jgi:hypothetical protein
VDEAKRRELDCSMVMQQSREVLTVLGWNSVVTLGAGGGGVFEARNATLDLVTSSVFVLEPRKTTETPD